jgi:hypothetical protein
MQFKKTTPEMTKELAGIMNVSPANLEFIINSFGGLPQDVQQLMNIGEGAAKGEGLRTNPLEESPFGQATKLPILKRFFRESTDFGSALQQQQTETKATLHQGITDKSL